MSPTDFILMEPGEAAGVSGGNWTDHETLLLLEAIELYKENWNEIAEHVATKTKTQCILHFVQMPIEETFMDSDFEIDASLKENADQSTPNNDSSAPKDPPETLECRTGGDENHPQSSSMEISKPEDASEVKVNQETKENCALKALKEAFEAVGSLHMPGDQFSFADAGNPVMTLAAFLVRLVEPKVAATLVRSSLKSISGHSSSTQLAMRHCFILEDPPYDKNKSADSERSDADTVARDAEKDEKQIAENKKEEKSNSVLDSGDLLNDRNHSKDGDSVSTQELSISPDSRSTEKILPKDRATGAKELDDLKPKANIHPSSMKGPGATARSTEESDDLTPKEEIPSSSAKEQGDRALEEGTSDSTEATKDAIVVVPDSLPSKKKEPEQLITTNSVTENGRNKGEEETKEDKNEHEDPLETDDYHNTDKVKRAAVTALSAAAVKAKLLADREEDQIRQLVILLIDKQLHKLETKLAFFGDMEGVVMRVREQMERSKQKLYQERAQIIASRMGFSGHTSRPMQQSLPINRVAMGFANSAAKSPMSTGMTSQRPPISRSMVMSPPGSNTFVPATSAGNPVRPTNLDKISLGPK